MLYAMFSVAFALDTGEMAPKFTLTSLSGQEVALQEYTGKIVVLEWFNPDCPYVKYAYSNSDLPKMQHQFTLHQTSSKGKSDIKFPNAKVDIVWLSINSGHPGKQGTDLKRNKEAKEQWGIKHPILFDPTGEVGRTYNPKTTPQFVVIDPDGKVQYQGALDNSPMGKIRDGNKKNRAEKNEKKQDGGNQQDYLFEALEQLSLGKKPNIHKSKPYGCSVKYK